MSPARDLDLFQLTDAEQATIERALKRYAAVIEPIALDPTDVSRAWATAELRQVQQLLATFEPEA